MKQLQWFSFNQSIDLYYFFSLAFCSSVEQNYRITISFRARGTRLNAEANNGNSEINRDRKHLFRNPSIILCAQRLREYNRNLFIFFLITDLFLSPFSLPAAKIPNSDEEKTRALAFLCQYSVVKCTVHCLRANENRFAVFFIYYEFIARQRQNEWLFDAARIQSAIMFIEYAFIANENGKMKLK